MQHRPGIFRTLSTIISRYGKSNWHCDTGKAVYNVKGPLMPFLKGLQMRSAFHNRSLVLVGFLILSIIAGVGLGQPRPLAAGAITRVSVSSAGGQANSDSNRPGISADGLYIVFESDATDLVPNDTNGVTDIFVHDRLTSQTRRVSVASDGTQAVGGGSYNPCISGDGRFAAFSSDATNLVGDDANSKRDIFVYDLQTGQVQLVSVSHTEEQGNGNSDYPSLDYDGSWIAYASAANNLVADDGDSFTDILNSFNPLFPKHLILIRGGLRCPFLFPKK